MTPFASTRWISSSMRRSDGIDAVDRAERAAEHVVEAVVGVRALERDDVDRLLDDADRRVVAARVEADRAGLLLGQVPALAAEADALLHLGERRGERERLLGRPLQDVEREPLRRPLPDPGQPRQLRDEVLDRGAEHRAIVPVRLGRTAGLSCASDTPLTAEEARPEDRCQTPLRDVSQGERLLGSVTACTTGVGSPRLVGAAGSAAAAGVGARRRALARRTSSSSARRSPPRSPGGRARGCSARARAPVANASSSRRPVTS